MFSRCTSRWPDSSALVRPNTPGTELVSDSRAVAPSRAKRPAEQVQVAGQFSGEQHHAARARRHLHTARHAVVIGQQHGAGAGVEVLQAAHPGLRPGRRPVVGGHGGKVLPLLGHEVEPPHAQRVRQHGAGRPGQVEARAPDRATAGARRRSRNRPAVPARRRPGTGRSTASVPRPDADRRARARPHRTADPTTAPTGSAPAAAPPRGAGAGRR